MADNDKIISDLKGLISIINDGKEGYKEAAENVESLELKNLFLEFMEQRAYYEQELKDHIKQHGGESENESGGILGALHRTWMDIKQALTSDEEEAILDAIITGEHAALEKYRNVLKDAEDHADHFTILRRHKDGIELALRQIESRKTQYKD